MRISPKVFLHTYGCQMNQYDGELVSGILQREGFTLISLPEEADVILLNTCSVREHAEQRVLGRLNALGVLKRRQPGLLIGVLGCMAQRLGDDLQRRVPAVDLVVGPDGYRRLPQMLMDHLNGNNGHFRFCSGEAGETYGEIVPQRRAGLGAFVAIMRGCNNFCTYCIVPYARGRERSRSPEEILAEIHQAVAEGFSEITLLGQNVNSYSWPKVDFPDLLEMIAQVEGLQRLRFLTSHPRDLGDKLIACLSRGGKVCPALHLPVQSGSDRILDLMGRGYHRQDYLEKVEELRRRVPGLALSTDLLCGFPSETEQDFQETLSLMKQAEYDDAFTFKYSPRPGTKAAQMDDDVPEAAKVERLERMIELSRQLADRSRRRLLGQKVEVLLENPSPHSETEWSGRTLCNRVALVPGSFQRGSRVTIQVEEVRGFSLWGKSLADRPS